MNRLNKFLALLFAAVLLLPACSDDDPAIPEDADDNFITALTLTLDGTRYDAVIANGEVTVSVPYNRPLTGATAELQYTPSATILPDPETITDWNREQIFRVTSYNGAVNEYVYRIIREEIVQTGDLEIRTAEEAEAFAETDVTVLEGNLILGTDEEEAEPLTQIAALSKLKEVRGTIIIRNSFGGDMSGLNNVITAGGIQIGTAEAPAATTLDMLCMKGLRQIEGDITVYDPAVAYVQFDKLETIGGSCTISSTGFANLEMPELTAVAGGLELLGTTEKDEAGGMITAIELPKLTTVGGRLAIGDLSALATISLPALAEAGSIECTTLPTTFSRLALPALSIVDGDFTVASVFQQSTKGNDQLTEIEGLDQVTEIRGTLTFSYLAALKPTFGSLRRLGGLTLTSMQLQTHTLDLSQVDLQPYGETVPTIMIDSNTYLDKLLTKEDLSQVNLEISGKRSSATTQIELNALIVNNLKYNGSTLTLLELPFERILGDCDISVNSRGGVSAPELTEVGGYLQVTISVMPTLFSFPKLEQVGGQFCFPGTVSATTSVDFSRLKSVCCAEDPHYAREGDISSTPYGSFFFRVSSRAVDCFPSLEHVGGKGLTIYGAKSLSLPALQTIDGTLAVTESTTLTEIDLPALTRLTGLFFRKLTKFTDFTQFGPFVQEGQIAEADWSVTSCGYNPTYEDMQAGRYTQE